MMLSTFKKIWLLPVVAVTLCSFCANEARSQDMDSVPTGWHLFRGDSNSSGVARTALPDQPEILWQYKQPEGAFESTPVIVPRAGDDSELMVVIGDLDGHLVGLNFRTGEKLWTFKTGIGFTTAPAYRDGKLFIGDIDGIFYCVDQNGKELWRFETEGEISSSASFFQDKVVFGSQDTSLYALAINNGELAWKISADDQIRCSTTIAGDRAFVAGCDGRLHVIDLKEGKEVGHVEIESPTGATPAVQGDLIFFGTEQGSFFGVDWKKIEKAWIRQDERGGNSIRSSAAVNDDSVIYGARNRQVVCLRPSDGKIKWTTALKAKIDSSPVITGERVFLGSTDGRMYLLNLADGKIDWQTQVNGGIIGSPAIAERCVVIATDRGVVYCLGSKTPATQESSSDTQSDERKSHD